MIITEKDLHMMVKSATRKVLSEMSLYHKNDDSMVNILDRENPEEIDQEKLQNGEYYWKYDGRDKSGVKPEDPIDLLIWRFKKLLPLRKDGWPIASGIRRWIGEQENRFGFKLNKTLRDDYTIEELYDILSDIRIAPGRYQG